jgi:hypothetical protein
MRINCIINPAISGESNCKLAAVRTSAVEWTNNNINISDRTRAEKLSNATYEFFLTPEIARQA